MKKFILGLMLFSSFSVFAASVECGSGDSYRIEYAVDSAQSALNAKIKKIEAQKKADPQVSRSISLSNLVMIQVLQGGGDLAVTICVTVD